MNARYYVGAIGRFASADTIVPNPVNPQGWNRYSYAFNNPLGYKDMDGHDPHWCGRDTSCITNYSSSMANAGATPSSSATTVNIADEYVDWYYSPSYSGCFKCHAAVANGQTILTNSELAAVDSGMREAGAKASAAAAIGAGTGYALSYGAQALVGAACADGDCGNELNLLRQQASNLRATGTSDGAIGGGRNIATANFNIGGINGNLQAVSGVANRASTVANPTTRLFTTNPERAFDSEVKIFEYLAQTFQSNPNVSGTITLYSERAVCVSCVGVLNQFMEMYPNVVIIINSGP